MTRRCEATLSDLWGDERRCSRTATVLVRGKTLCWQHKRQEDDPGDVGAFAELDHRTVFELQESSPYNAALKSEIHWTIRLRWKIRPDGDYPFCYVCGKRAKTSRVVTNPISLRRGKIPTCKRRRCSRLISDWEGRAETRRRRAQYDWERQHPTDPARLIAKMPPQYPSLSRATLRAFIESGEEVATVDGSDGRAVTALNSSIRSLGFAGLVFAEQRSNQAILRRAPKAEAAP